MAERAGSSAIRRSSCRSVRHLAGAVLLAMAAAACGQAPLPSATPSPAPRIAATPGTEPRVRAWILAYRQLHGVPPFDLDVMPLQAGLRAAKEGSVALLIAASPPPQGWFATPLEAESLVVVVNPANPVRDLSREAMAGVFTGRTAGWEALGGSTQPAQPVTLLPGDDLRAAFEAWAFPDSSASPASLLGADPAGVAARVRADPGAIGYLPAAYAAGDLRVLRLSGQLPTDRGYPLTILLSAVAPREPSGAVRDWLAWVQASQSGG